MKLLRKSGGSHFFDSLNRGRQAPVFGFIRRYPPQYGDSRYCRLSRRNCSR